MHGLIFVELKKYVESRYNQQAWEALEEKAGVKHQMYLSSNLYPDGDALNLVAHASRMTGLSADALLEDFGEFLAPDLIEQYKFLLKPEWGLLEFLENTEETIHKIMRFHHGASPPRLAVLRTATDKAILSYSSGRRLCALVKGILKGSARHYREEITVLETSCMTQGDAQCTFSVQVESARPRAEAGAFAKAMERRE